MPTDKVAATIALADKLDTLMGFWSIDEKPTGAKDPYALRRAALGVIRIILQNDFRMALKSEGVSDDLLSFFHDRLKVFLRDQDARHDLIDAVITSDADDLLMIARRVEALTAFLNTDDGQNLLAGYKRSTNILAAEEKKGAEIGSSIDASLLVLPEEKALAEAIDQASTKAESAVAAEDFGAAMQAVSIIRGPIDAFFDAVLVNDDDPKIRANRLALLAKIRSTTSLVADFTRIEG